MRIKTTALFLCALLPLSVWAMPGEGQQGQQGQQNMQGQQKLGKQGQQQKNSEWNQENTQKRQAAWFDRLELTAEQRQVFQKEMQEHRQLQQKARTAHHDKLRAVLTDKQRVTFDQETEKMQQRMRNKMQQSEKSPRSGQNIRSNAEQ